MPNLNLAYQWAINTCNASNVRYNQDYRNQQTDENGNVCYDCSSFIWYALLAGGFDVVAAFRTATGETYDGNAIWTAVMRPWLTALGFVEVDINGEWQPADVLWRSGHAEMVYTGGTGEGVTMGAHSKNRPAADQVSINSYTSSASSWTALYRYPGGAVSTPSIYVISAIAGNFYQESQINPGLWEGLNAGTAETLLRGFGLGQWTNTGGDTHGRLYQLMDWLSDNGFASDSGEGQLQYLMYENTWYCIGYATNYANLNAFLLSNSTGLDGLTRAWCSGWEGLTSDNDPDMVQWENRIRYAHEFYEYLSEHYADPVTDWIAGNRYLTTAESQNNAIMLYHFFAGMTPPTPGPPYDPGRKNKMPVWMMLPFWA